MNLDLANYYSKVGYYRASGLSEEQAHALADELFTSYEFARGERLMSRHSKKRKRIAQNRGMFPEIKVDDANEDRWLYWLYFFGPHQVRVDIPLIIGGAGAEREGWLFVDGDPLIQDTQLTWEEAEAAYGAKTRLRLLEKHRIAIIMNCVNGLAKLQQEATELGLFGKRERLEKTYK